MLFCCIYLTHSSLLEEALLVRCFPVVFLVWDERSFCKAPCMEEIRACGSKEVIKTSRCLLAKFKRGVETIIDLALEQENIGRLIYGMAKYKFQTEKA
ncbi:hypothetical protein CHUAL_013195 [Chamberlinius hualienensis]